MSELIKSTPFDSAIELRLNRPEKGNALSASLVERLHDAMDVAFEAGHRIIIFAGAGAHFCTGFDLSDIASSSDADLLARFVRIELLLQKVASAPCLTACYAHGRTMGAGADLFVACSKRPIAPETTFAFPGAQFGIVLGFGRLAARVGASHALEYVRSGRQIAAGEAVEIGLADKIVPDDERAALVREWDRAAGRLAQETVRDLSVFSSDRDDRDLAALVRSASRTGLTDRISKYRATTGMKRSPSDRG
jgi:enoyl-CoA hydratase/carnithine racemase